MAGISNNKRKFIVMQFVYNCQYLTSYDIPVLVNAIRQASFKGEYNDPFANIPEKGAKSILLEPIEPVKDSIIPWHNIINEYYENVNLCNKTIRLIEVEFKIMLTDVINQVLNEIICSTQNEWRFI